MYCIILTWQSVHGASWCIAGGTNVEGYVIQLVHQEEVRTCLYELREEIVKSLPGRPIHYTIVHVDTFKATDLLLDVWNQTVS